MMFYMKDKSFCFHKTGTSHHELILFPGIILAADVWLEFHIVFEWLSGGREGNRGQTLNHQTMKHTHEKREGKKAKEVGERRTQFQVFIPR